MESFKRFFLLHFLKCILAVRYRIKVKGLESFTKKRGILFLANHPAEIDPLILISVLWPKFHVHPVAIDFLFHQPLIRPFLEIFGTLPVPNFEDYTNSYKIKQMEKTYEKIDALLAQGQNVLIYPGGGLKTQGEEIIGGASGVHTILQRYPEATVALVRSSGLWGSSFSAAFTGRAPGFVKQFLKNLKVVAKNLVFFVPKRDVLVECTLPDNFPMKESRLKMNRYLEKWYNERGPEPLKLVSYSFWKKELPALPEKREGEKIDFEKVPQEVTKKVIEEIAKLSHGPKEGIEGNQNLAIDLGLDSLDQAQLVIFLKENFGVVGIHSSDLLTVNDVIAIAARLKRGKEKEEEEEKPLEGWLEEKNRPPFFPLVGETLIDVFFNNASKMENAIAAVDPVVGVVTYQKVRVGVLLMAEAIAKMPGQHIGIMMPASIAVNILILATILAGKIPVMINWTLGPRNLKVVIEQAELLQTLSSWRFLDRLENTDLNGFDNTITLVEDLRRGFSFRDKLRMNALSKKSTSEILNYFGRNQLKKEDTAVILFTSGTEGVPKGVPLTHNNLLSNLRDSLSLVAFNSSDTLLGVLPPFHSFGFSVTGLFPLLSGMKVAYLPNPTEGRKMAKAIEKWKISVVCLAPTFLKNLVRVATPLQLQSLRLIVSGAEKMGSDLKESLKKMCPQARIIEGYGITECAPILSINPPEATQKGVGVPLPSVKLCIIDPETKEVLGVNQEGLILAQGPNVFHGYLDPHVASPFIEMEGTKWYQTGDLGSIDEKKYLTLSGRLKRFTKVGGEMISLSAIEETLVQMAATTGWKIDPELPSLAVTAREEPNSKKPEICLFTTFPISMEDANAALKKSGLSNIFRITQVKEIPFIPLLGTGKIDYRALTNKIEIPYAKTS